MEGIIAQTFGLNYPDRILSLILCGSFVGGLKRISSDLKVLKELSLIASPTPDMTERDRTLKLLYLLYSAEYIEENLDAFIKDETYSDYPTPSYALNRQSNVIAGFDSYARLNKIKFPVLVMTGLDDALVPAANSDILGERIPQAQLIRIHGCGHGFLKQKTDEAIRHVLRFLEEVDN